MLHPPQRQEAEPGVEETKAHKHQCQANHVASASNSSPEDVLPPPQHMMKDGSNSTEKDKSFFEIIWDSITIDAEEDQVMKCDVI